MKNLPVVAIVVFSKVSKTLIKYINFVCLYTWYIFFKFFIQYIVLASAAFTLYSSLFLCQCWMASL